MKRFAVIGHRAVTDPGFPLNDMPGSAGRMDVLCRCVNASFFLSHGLRRDVECFLILKGAATAADSPVSRDESLEDGERTILLKGETIRSLNPDERSAGALIKKALAQPCGDDFRETSPGVFIRCGGLLRLLADYPFAVLDEGGTDIRSLETLPGNLLLSDHLNFTDAEEELIADLPRISVGNKILHGDHTITIFLNEADRRDA